MDCLRALSIVTWDDEAEFDSGIKVVQAWKWLLAENNPQGTLVNERANR